MTQAMDKEPCSRLNYLIYTGHFTGELYRILYPNCLISIHCLSHTKRPEHLPFTEANTLRTYMREYPPTGMPIPSNDYNTYRSRTFLLIIAVIMSALSNPQRIRSPRVATFNEN